MYDNNGNIVKKREFSKVSLKVGLLLEEEDSRDMVYVYEGDRLVSYGGADFVYDVMGNPTTYRGKAAKWERGLQKEQLLISSNDIFFPSKNYKKKLFKKFKWDLPGNTLFDDQLHDFKNRILDKAIFSVQMFGKDLILTFDENYKIEILACTLEQEREYFRIFKKGDLNSHIVVES